MKSIAINQPDKVAADSRRGSTLVIVIALLGIMAFLGLTFYTFAKQERQTAATFSQAAQTLKAPSIEPDSLFDFAMQQLLLGPVDSNYQSILWGGRHSLLANMLGRDGIPFNGEGINLIPTPGSTGQPAVDMNYDGAITLTTPTVDNQALLNFVDSPAANLGSWGNISGTFYFGANKRFRPTGGALNNTIDLPEPDVNYNSPDINSIFLSYDGTAYSSLTINGNSPSPQLARAIIPSFLRPQYLRYNALAMSAAQNAVNSQWQGWYCSDGTATTPSTANQVMRPHPQHYCVDNAGNVLMVNVNGTPTPIPRYTSQADYQALNLRRPFTYSSKGAQTYFAPDTSLGNPFFGQGTTSTAGNLGIWTNSAATDIVGYNTTDLFYNNGNNEAPYSITQYQQHLDVDTDGDGILDAILMDLGYPAFRRGDGKLVVPLFAISVRDLNGLVNLNASGNLAGNLNLSGTQSMGNVNTPPASPTSLPTTQLGYQLGLGSNSPTYPYIPDNLSKSNLGLTTSEINPQRVLTADPTYNTVTTVYTDEALVHSEIGAQLGYFLKAFDSTMLPTTSYPNYRPVPGRSIAELANLEWLLFNIGRPSFNLGYLTVWFQNSLGGASPPTATQQTLAILNALTDLFPGRYGEANQSTYVTPANANALTTFNNLNPSLPTTVYNGSLAVPNFNSQIASYVSQTYTNGVGATVPAGTANVINNINNNLSTYTGRPTDVPAASLAKFITTRQLANTYDQPLSLYDLPKPGLSTTWMPPGIGVEAPISWPAQTVGIQTDDNTNFNEGEPYVPSTGATTSTIQWMSPVDFRGSGRHFQRFSWGADGQPGYANVDDDGDGVVDNFTEEGWPNTDDTYTAGGATYFVTYGKYPNLTRTQTPNPAAPATPSMPGAPPLTPLYFPAFSGYHSFYSGSNPFSGYTSGGVRWGDYGTTPAYFNTQIAALPSLLMRGSIWNSLFDEPAESIIDPTIMSPAYTNYLRLMSSNNTGGVSAPLSSSAVTALQNSIANDAVLGPEEMLFLQGTTVDARLTEDRSRLAELMPGNLVASKSAANIRKRLTTVSSDRREFGAGAAVVGGLRSWECWPLISLGNNNMQQSSFLFPPARCTTSLPTSTATSLIDPYRPELYYFLQQLYSPQLYATSSVPVGSQSLKLNVNRFLFLDGISQTQYGFAPLPVQTSVQDTNATLVRQNMARDIYTLLYTFCFVHTDGAGNFDLDYRTIAAANVPTPAQAKEMAQFAVNLVDALDTDNIITAFYYDPDLSNNVTTNGGGTVTNAAGWDPAASIGNDQIPQTSDDYVVYGVERQQLVISEATVFQLKKGAGGNTNYDSSTSARTFCYLELENVSPTNVTLAPYQVYPPNESSSAPLAPAQLTWGSTALGNVVANGNWRIRMSDPTSTTPYNVLTLKDATGNLPASGQYNAVYLLPNLDSQNFFPTTTTPPGTNQRATTTSDLVLPAGGTFTISSGDGVTGTPTVSDLRTSAGALIVPANLVNGETDNQAAPQCNLDLVYNYGDTSAKRYWLQVGSSGTTGLPSANGSFLTQLRTSANGLTNPVRLTLETNVAAGPNPDPSDSRLNNWQSNTWAAVDSTANYSQLLAAGSPKVTNNNINDMTIQSYGPAVSAGFSCSFPRSVPILSGTVPLAAAANSFNTASNVATSNSASAYIQREIPWQLQYDRDFTSLGELMQLPLYGPDMLTTALAEVITTGSSGATPKWPNVSNSQFYSQTTYNTTKTAGVTNYYPTVAAARFLRPDNPDYTLNYVLNNSVQVLPTNSGNRWYRLFNFLEVPSRFNQHVSVTGQPPSSMSNPPITNISPQPPNVTPAVLIGSAAPNGSGTYTSFAFPGTPGATSLYPIVTSGLFSAPLNLPQYFGWPRVHGQLNLNLIRHPQVLLALLDDDQMVYDPRFYAYSLPTSSNSNNPPTSTIGVSPFLDSVDPDDFNGHDGYNRQWWLQFIIARDSRYSPTIATSYQPDAYTGYYVPGTASARPFKALDSIGQLAYRGPAAPTGTTGLDIDNPVEDTVLRGLPYDSYNSGVDTSPAVARRLFEVGNYSEHFEQIGATATTTTATETNPTVGAGMPNPLHPSARHRLLSKLMNNTTTRSNSFAVYITVQYYEAAQITSNSGVVATRIGGLLDDAPVHRGFFVVDRTGAIEQIKTVATNAANGTIVVPNSPNPNFPVSSGSYSFQPNTDPTGLRVNQNGIRWKDLILYRRTLN